MVKIVFLLPFSMQARLCFFLPAYYYVGKVKLLIFDFKHLSKGLRKRVNIVAETYMNLIFFSVSYYHFRSTLKRDDFFAYVYFSIVTVSQTSVSSGPMKMRCFGRETNNVCQTTVCMFCSRGWQVFKFSIVLFLV